MTASPDPVQDSTAVDPSSAFEDVPTAVSSINFDLGIEKSEKMADRPVTPIKEVGAKEEEEEVEYPGPAKLALITLGLCLAIFVVALDNTIIATAIPTITSVFNSLDDVGWYGSAYFLTNTTLQPSFGKIYTNFDIKITFLVSLIIFEIGSIICAAAVNSSMLIAGRAIAGVGASSIFSGGMIIISHSVPLQKRPVYLGSLSSMFGIASVVGPLMGGAFTDHVSWRWCFWINLPFGGFAIASILFFFKSPKRKQNLNLTLRQKLLQIDILGAIFLIAGVTCLLLALQWGGSTYAWKNSRIIGLFIGFGLIISVFIVIQMRRGQLATIPPSIIGQRTVLVSFIWTAFFCMAFYIQVYYLPFYFQSVKGTSAVGSGIRTIPMLVSTSVTSVVVGGIVTMTGHYFAFMPTGAAIFTVGAGLLSTLDVNTSTGRWIGYQLIGGIGGGMAFQIPWLAIQVTLSSADQAIGNSLVTFANTLGGAISISIAQNILSNELLKQVPKYAPQVNPRLVINAGATHLREVIPPDLLPGVLKAYAKALQLTLVPPIAFGGVAFFIALFLERRKIQGKAVMAGAA